jgi:hypothetical protein
MGVERTLRGNLLWTNNHVPTTSIVEWIKYYYNPIGFYGVWDHDWLFPNFPTAAAIFWSLVLRIGGVCFLMWLSGKHDTYFISRLQRRCS